MAKTKEELAAYNKAYRLANKERIDEQIKASYLRNREKRLEQMKKNSSTWKKANPEKVAAKNKRYLLKLNLVNKKISIRTLNAWAVQVKEAVSFCEWCYSEDNLEAHHILPKAKFPQHALDLKNGRTMCNYCHKMIHKQGGF
jgi:hypothetical protein